MSSPNFSAINPCFLKIAIIRLPPSQGWIAQLVEQRTENPRVPGSIPGPATSLLVKRRDVVAQIKADGVEVNQNAILQYGSTELSVCQQA